MTLNLLTLIGVVALLTQESSLAATLKVGDKAPSLQVSEWIQGEPVKSFEPGKAYIVEFWATWCGPCRVSIPHLNELHTKFKDKGLVVIGQDVWEEDTSAVKPFVKQMGSKMTYRVALDQGSGTEGKMAKTWMEAAGRNGIPSAFVVQKAGRIAWIGHPMTLKEEMLEEVLAGKYDLKKARAKAEREAEIETITRGLWQQVNAAEQKEEWSAAEEALRKIEQALGEEGPAAVIPSRFRMALAKRDLAQVRSQARAWAATDPSDAMVQNQVAWNLISADGIGAKEIATAEEIIVPANKATGGKNAEILDTYARVLFLKGERDKALSIQKDAIKYAPENRQPGFKNNLAAYESGKAPQEGKTRNLRRQFSRALKAKDWNQAESTLQELDGIALGDDKTMVKSHRMDLQLLKGEYAAAWKTAAELGEAFKDNASQLNELAWDITTRKDIAERDLALAEKLALKADELSQGKSPETVDTLARVYFEKGEKEKAVKTQTRAVEVATGKRKAQFEETLNSYKAGKAPKDY